jgi:hypothetical protein
MTPYLHEIKRGSKIYAELTDGSTYLIFNNLDGMYSHCTTEKGNIIHLSAMTQLKKETRKNEYSILDNQ